jgi:hypothetical protein
MESNSIFEPSAKVFEFEKMCQNQKSQGFKISRTRLKTQTHGTYQNKF